MYMSLKILMLLAILCMLVACGDQRVLESLGFIQTTSYDLYQESDSENTEQEATKLLITSTIPRPQSEGLEASRAVMSTTAYTSKEARIKLSSQSELTLVSGQLRNVLFGTSLAKQGIWAHIDTLIRDPSISPRVKVTIVNGRAHDLLKKEFPQHPRTGQYLDHLLEKEASAHMIPQINLYQFTRDYLDDGIDPIAPIVSYHAEDIVLDGIALFRDDHYVTKIEPDQALVFFFLRGRFKNGDMSVDLSTVGRKNEYLMFNSLINKHKIKIAYHPDRDNYQADIYIKVTGSVLEYTGTLSLDKEDDQKTIEKLVAQYITIKGEEMIALMKENSVDSIGLGKYIRRTLSYDDWKSLDWDEVYSNLEVNCHVDVRIKDYGKFVNGNS